MVLLVSVVPQFLADQNMFAANLFFEEGSQASLDPRSILGHSSAELVMDSTFLESLDRNQLYDLSPTTEPASIGLPVRISIASIAVDAPIQQVGLASDGSMDVPNLPFDTAWYKPGPRPGEKGSAAIAGHLNWMDGSDAVFADLDQVKIGDEIVVSDDQGTRISFVIRKIRRYGATEDARDVFRSDDGGTHLNIITCDGAWDNQMNQYAQRLVVFADKS